MIHQEKNPRPADERQQDQFQNVSNANDAVEDDGSPVLDEQDLEENQLTVEEADNIEWDEPSGENR